jgi:nitroreductase/CTP:molybdopterin cytidylyltransferase MocA
MQRIVAIVPAAGLGRRLGEDKALVDLAGRPAIDRLVGSLHAAGVHDIVVVRRRGAAPLPPDLPARVVAFDPDDEAGMVETVRTGLAAAEGSPRPFLVLPVDHALVAPWTIEQVARRLLRAEDDTTPEAAPIVLPLAFDRPGHPAGFVSRLAPRLQSVANLRELIRSERVAVVPTDDRAIRADLDDAEDLRRARARLAEGASGVLATMRRHRSCRSFTSDPVDDELLEHLVDAARHCSTSSFAQLYTLVAVRDAARRDRIAALCSGQAHVRDAPVFVAICADLERIARCCERHGREPQLGSFEAFLQAAVDAALVGQNLQLAAEAEGLAACMIGAARNHPVELARELALPARTFVVYGMALGWPAGERVAHGRMPLRGVLHTEQFDASGARLDQVLEGADDGMRDWARRVNAAGGYGGKPVSEDKGWADRMAAMWGSDRGVKGRADLLARLRELGFLDDEG